METESETAAEVVGTCTIRVQVREGSPLLEQILSGVGIDGLPTHVCSEPTGRLQELIDARQQSILAGETQRLKALADDQLVAEVLVEECACVDLAVGILVDRLWGGSGPAFGALYDAVTGLEQQDIAEDSYLEDRYSMLRDICDDFVAAARPSVDRLTEQELEHIIERGKNDSQSCAARERLEDIELRLFHLETIPHMPLDEIIQSYNAGEFLDQRVRRLARERLARETMGDEEIANLLPFGESRVEEFLTDLGITRIGYLHAPRANCKGNRWAPEEVRQKIECTTARLLFRATSDFKGRLPDDLHVAMMLAQADEFQKRYVDWLKQNGLGANQLTAP
jgi:hypothetical protein